MKEERKGEMIMYLAATVWAFFPVITILSYGNLPSILSLTFTTLVSALFFLCFVIYKKTWSEFKNPMLWKYSLGIVIFIGVFYYGFYYTGLTATTAGNAGIIALFEVFTSFLFFHLIKKEAMSRSHILGAFCMVLGAIIVLAPNFHGINRGDIFIFCATFFPPIGNMFQQKAKMIASTETILFLRSILAVPLLFLLAYIMGNHATLLQVKLSLPFILVSGIVLFGLDKILWLEAIHRISVTKGIALYSLSPFLTLVVAWLLLHQAPTVWQITALIPLTIGVLLLTDRIRRAQ